MDRFTRQLLGSKSQGDVVPNGFKQPRSHFYNSTIRNYWEQGGSLAPIIPHPYKSQGIPVYRDTTALPFKNGGELLAQPYPNSFFASDLGNYYADGGPLHDRDNETGKLLNSTYASALGSMFRDGGYFDHGYSLPEDSFRQGGRGLKDSIYASTSGQYPAPYKYGGSILSMSNTPQLEGEGKDLNYPSKGYAYGNGGMLKRADGSYSKRGLWDNIRANRGSGKAPTKEMLAQERKIRNKKGQGGAITTSQLFNQANFFEDGGYGDPPPKLITYKNDAKLIDGTAAFDLITNPKIANRITADYNQEIKDRLYSGKWGYDPNSGALVKLNKSQQTTIPTDIKNIRQEEKEDREYKQAIARGEIKPRIDTPIQQPANQQMTKQEVEDFVRKGYNAAILNPAFQTAAYFTPPGMAIGAIQGAANLIPDLYAGDYGYAALDAASMLPFAKPIANTVKSAVKNTYKINPWRFKVNPEAYYRGVGKDGIDDILESGIIRSKKQHAYPEPYFSKGVIGDHYAKGYFAELVNEPMKGVGSFPEGSLIQTPVNTISVNNPNLKLYKKDWLKGYKEVPKPQSAANTPVKSGLGGVDMSRYEIKNPDYYSQLLDTYTSRVLPSSSKKFYKSLIETVKKQNGLVTEKQLNELDRLKTGNFDFGKRGYNYPNQPTDFQKTGFDGNLITRPLTPFSTNELTTGNQWYRKIGNEAGLQDLINKQGAKAPAPMKMKSGIMLDAPFFGRGASPTESYKGLYAVEVKPEAASKYNWRSRVAGVDNYGSVPFENDRLVSNFPLEDLNVYRKKWFSNNYKQLDPTNLEEGLKNAALQRNLENVYKWGVRGYLGKSGYDYVNTPNEEKKYGGEMENASAITTSKLFNRYQ